MLKGCQKDMIVLHTKDSPLFEDAFFVLRPTKSKAPRTDMLTEAARIIAGGNTYLKKRGKKRGVVLAFCGGLLLGGGLVLLLRVLFGF